MDPDQEMQILKNHVLMLSEHFDTVQVFATRHISNEKGTVQCNAGAGNFFARFGQVQFWLEDQSLKDAEED